MKRIRITLLGLLLITGCKETVKPSKPVDFIALGPQIESVMVYDVEPTRDGDNSKIYLESANEESFDVALFRELAPQIVYKNQRENWKGGLIAVVKTNDGAEVRLAFSFYGSFFKVIGQKGYYYIEGEGAEGFYNAFHAIIKDKFHPLRNERVRKQKLSRLRYYIEVLQKKQKGSMMEATDTIGGLGSAAVDAVPALIEVIEAKDNNIRQNAVWALGMIGSGAKEAMPALEKCANDKSVAVQKEAADAIRKIQGKPDPSR